MMSLTLGAVMQRSEAPRPSVLVVFFVVKLCLFNYCYEKYCTCLRYFSLCSVYTHELRNARGLSGKVEFCSTVQKLSSYMKMKFHDQIYKIPPLYPSWDKWSQTQVRTLFYKIYFILSPFCNYLCLEVLYLNASCISHTNILCVQRVLLYSTCPVIFHMCYVFSHRMFPSFINSKKLIIMHLFPHLCYFLFILIILFYVRFSNTDQVCLNWLTLEDGTDRLSRNFSE